MTTLLGHRPDTASAVHAGVVEMHALLDRMHAHATVATPWGGHGPLVAELDRAARRIQALKLKVLAAADRAGAAADAGFTGTEAWVARTTTVTRGEAAREVRWPPSSRPGTRPPPRRWTRDWSHPGTRR